MGYYETKYPKGFDTQSLQDAYNESDSISDLARKFGIAPNTMLYHLKKHGITIRKSGWKSPNSGSQAGAKANNWQGGRTINDGYIMIYLPTHPKANGKGYVPEHRLVMEKRLGRFLTENEIVHHINENSFDNRDENLELFSSRSEHISHHKSIAPRDPKTGRFL